MDDAQMMFDGKEIRVVLVEWTDCETMAGWQEEADIRDYMERPLTIMQSVGWLLHDHEKYIILAQSVDQDQIEGFKAGELLKIPWTNIIAVAPFQATGIKFGPIGLDDVKIEARDWMPPGIMAMRDSAGNVAAMKIESDDGK